MYGAHSVFSRLTRDGGVETIPAAIAPITYGRQERHAAIEPVVFGREDRPLFGISHVSELAPERSLAVVFCNPLGHEAMSAHRTYRHLAQRFAKAGFRCLRFDYDGTGDSAGGARDPDRVRAWIDSIKSAVAEARALSGAPQVALFGFRFGATLAVRAAEELGGVEALIVWAPIVSGRAHVRELRAYRMMKSAKVSSVLPADGSEEVAGYWFPAEALADMSRLELLGGTGRAARRALVLPRNERAADETRLVEHLKKHGTEARLAQLAGYGRIMREDPYESEVPLSALDGIVEWLGEEIYSEGPTSSPQAPSRSEIDLAPGRGETPLVERTLLFGEENRLFGILTEPPAPVRSDRPVLVFLNVGANTHVGPHRMNVELTRELASLGYRTFRFDVAGLGESRVPPGVRENRIYTMDSVADVKAAMDLVSRLSGASRFVLIGLCSGAYLAFHSAVADTRVVGQVLLSSFAFEWKEGDPVTPTERALYNSTRSYGRAILDYRVWLRALRGGVNVRGIAGILLERLKTRISAELPEWKARIRGRGRDQNKVERAFHAMCDRRVQSLLVFSFNDSGLDMIGRYLGRDACKMRNRREFALEIADGADHTFTSIESQATLSRILKRYLETHFS